MPVWLMTVRCVAAPPDGASGSNDCAHGPDDTAGDWRAGAFPGERVAQTSLGGAWTRMPFPQAPCTSSNSQEYPSGGRLDCAPPSVERPRLIAQLDSMFCCPVTLVSAPAGWGKTSLLAQWAGIAVRRGHVLWYDAGIDGDYAITPEVWRRIVEELTGLGAIGADRADGTGDAGQRALEPVRAAPIVVVMDDFDELAAPDLLTGVEYLVRVLKGRVRVVLSCRTVPPLPLHRWRVTGELGEVRADQLAFTLDETAELISAYKVGLADSSVAELHALTEGWPAGLRLAALAMRDHPEPEQVVAELGTDDGVASYLSREVLAALPPDTCRTMAEVSVVEQVTAAMVEALTGRRDGARMLAALDQQGAFVYRRPGPGERYRFHPLLSRLLYSELRRQDPARAALAHRRAAQWYIAHGPPAEALRHLLVAEDWATARETMDQHWPDIAVGARRRSLKEGAPTPPRAIHTEPGLAWAFAAERLDAADPVQARRFLRMGGDDRDDPAADNRSRAPVLLALQLAEARLAGDLEQTVEVATRLMSVSSTNDAVGRTVPAGPALGLA